MKNYHEHSHGTSQDTSSEADVCLIIPVYNEEPNLGQLAAEISKAMESQPRTWRVLMVNDGSSDGSLNYLRELAQKDPHFTYISLAANRGQSAAFAAGFQESQSRVFVTLDSDLQNDPADIPAMLDLFDQGNDMVVGWRGERKDSGAKRLASRIGNGIRNRILNESIRDTGCSLKAMRGSMAKKLPVFKGMHRYFPALMSMQNAKIAEIRVNHRPRIHGQSNYGVLDRALCGISDLFAVRWLQKRHISYSIDDRG